MMPKTTIIAIIIIETPPTVSPTINPTELLSLLVLSEESSPAIKQ